MVNKLLEFWVEKYNGATWDIVADSGLSKRFQLENEYEFNYYFSSYFLKNEKYRLRSKTDTDTGIVLTTQTLTNGVKMPAIRLSISG